MPEFNAGEFNAQEFNDSGQTNPTTETTGMAATYLGFWSVGVGGGVM